MYESNQKLREAILQCRFFEKLPQEKIEELLPLFKHVYLSAGNILFHQGDSSDDLYVLIKGELISLLNKPSGNTVIVGTISPIETVGELGALSGEPRSLTIEAIVDCELLKLPSYIFKELCQESPSILMDVFGIVLQRSLQTIKLIAHEKVSYNVSIIYSLTQHLPGEILANKLKHYFAGYEVTFIASDGMEIAEVQSIILNSEKENRPVYIFMTRWNEEIFTFCLKKISHLYLTFGANEKLVVDKLTKEIINNVKHLPTVKLNLLLIHPDSTRQIANTRKWLKIADFNMHHHVRINHHEDFQRLVRFMTGNAFVLVLGGGGAKGLAHLGVLRALHEKNIPIDAIGATSIGAGIGGAFALTYDYEKTIKLLKTLTESARQSITSKNLTWPLISLYSSNPATKTLMDLFGNVCIEDLWIPFFAVSSNLSERKEKIHNNGLLWEAIRCSAAIPGIFPPVAIDGQLLVDGGILNNLPVDIMRELIGPGHIIIASSMARKYKDQEHYQFPAILTLKKAFFARYGWAYKDYVVPPFFETFMDSMLLGSSSLEEKNSYAADILIKPNLHGFKTLSLMQQKENELNEIGYRETLKSIEKFLSLNPDYKKW